MSKKSLKIHQIYDTIEDMQMTLYTCLIYKIFTTFTQKNNLLRFLKFFIIHFGRIHPRPDLYMYYLHQYGMTRH